MWWVPLAAAAINAAGKTAAAEASGTKDNSTNPFFGPITPTFDNSGWTLNFGDSASVSAKAGDRSGPSVTAAADWTKSMSPSGTPSPQSQSVPAWAPTPTAYPSQGIPTSYLVAAAIVVGALVLTRKG